MILYSTRDEPHTQRAFSTCKSLADSFLHKAFRWIRIEVDFGNRTTCRRIRSSNQRSRRLWKGCNCIVRSSPRMFCSFGPKVARDRTCGIILRSWTPPLSIVIVFALQRAFLAEIARFSPTASCLLTLISTRKSKELLRDQADGIRPFSSDMARRRPSI